MVAVGIVWIPIVQNFSELFHYIQSITSYLAPPVCAVYVLAVLWKRTNEQVGLMVDSPQYSQGQLFDDSDDYLLTQKLIVLRTTLALRNGECYWSFLHYI